MITKLRKFLEFNPTNPAYKKMGVQLGQLILGTHEHKRTREVVEAMVTVCEHAITMHKGFEQDIATVPRSIVASHLNRALANLRAKLEKAERE